MTAHRTRPLFAAILFAYSCTALADEFMAMPGLWDTRIQRDGEAPQQDWHCVDEEADPWTAYIPDFKTGAACTLTPVRRTATSLQWRQQCGGARPLLRTGRLSLDSAQHYSGDIEETVRAAAGTALPRRVHIEGTRRAACTSPSD